MNKKGQFTILVIIAVIVIASIIYFTTVYESGDEVLSAEDVEFASPVQNYVETCIGEIGREALELAALQGGYVNATKFTTTEGLPYTRQDAVENPPGSGTPIPYWHYVEGDCSEQCSLGSNRPSLEGGEFSISSQVEEYVNDNIERCTDFTGFENLEVQEVKTPEATVSMGDGSVGFTLDYALDVSDDNRTARLETFTQSLGVDFRKLYMLSNGLSFYFEDTKFLDKVTQDILVAHSSGKEPAIPPVGHEASFKNNGPWTKQDVRSKLSQYINDEVSKISLDGSLNMKKVITSNIEDLQNLNLVLPYNTPHYAGVNWTNLEVTLDYYPWWELGLDIKGSEGESGQVFMSEPKYLPSFLRGIIPSLKIYSYSYDVSYPVLVRISQPNAFNGEGFDFQFAVEANVFNNDPANGTVAQPISVQGSGTYFCDRTTWRGGDVNISVLSELDNSGVERASVEYVCGTESCLLGSTNESGMLSTKTPSCSSGELEVSSPGYSQETLEVVPSEKEYTARITPETEIEAKVLKKMLSKYRIPPVEEDPDKRFELPSWSLSGTVGELSRGEEAIIVLEKVDNPSYKRSVVYNGSDVPARVSLLPGHYSAEGYLLKRLPEDEPLIIEEDEYCYRKGFKEKCEPIPEIEINTTAPIGGLELSNVEITQEDLEKGVARFYVSAINPSDLEYHADINVFEEYSNITEENPAAFEPLFTNS